MKSYTVLFGSIMILNLTGCTSAQEMKDEAHAKYTEEKTATLKEYKECVNKSEGVPAKMAQCEALLKAVGAVEGSTIAVAVPVAAPAAPAADPTSNAAPTPVENSQPATTTETTQGN